MSCKLLYSVVQNNAVLQLLQTQCMPLFDLFSHNSSYYVLVFLFSFVTRERLVNFCDIIVVSVSSLVAQLV